MLPHDLNYGPIDLARPRRYPGNPTWAARKGQRTWNERHADFEVRIDRHRVNPQQCEIEGCTRIREDFGRYCQHHRDRKRMTGHAEGHQLRRQWIAPLVAEAARYIHQVRAMPPDATSRRQLILVEHWLHRWFHQAPGYDRITFRPGQSLELRARRWIATLARHDGTPDKVLAMVTGVLAYDNLLSTFLDLSHRNHQIAKLVLAPAPRRPEWAGGQPELLGYRLGQHIGSALVEGLMPFCQFAVPVLTGEKPMAGWPERSTAPLPKMAIRNAVRRPKYRPLADDEE